MAKKAKQLSLAEMEDWAKKHPDTGEECDLSDEYRDKLEAWCKAQPQRPCLTAGLSWMIDEWDRLSKASSDERIAFEIGLMKRAAEDGSLLADDATRMQIVETIIDRFCCDSSIIEQS